MRFLSIVFAILLRGGTSSLQEKTSVVGWYLEQTPLRNFPWSCYTHLHAYGPSVDPDGFASCNTSNTPMLNLINETHNHGKKFVWDIGMNLHPILWENQTKKKINYIATIGKAMEKCNIDGIESDYEWGDTDWGKTGIIPALMSTKYTEFLASIKRNIAPHREVSADISVWGIAKGEWLLGVYPWVNVSMLNSGQIDYVNTMSYHHAPRGEIWPWKKDGLFLHTFWGMDKARVNIGIPYYNVNGNAMITKKTNQQLGEWVKENGWRGTFVFAATYDNYTDPLVYSLCEGLRM
jgi:hypothetical protein